MQLKTNERIRKSSNKEVRNEKMKEDEKEKGRVKGWKRESSGREGPLTISNNAQIKCTDEKVSNTRCSSGSISVYHG